MRDHKLGITAIEVLVSTLLASLLMVAMLGVLRGLKAQAAALDTRLPRPTWNRTLNNLIGNDLESARTFSFTSTSLVINGFSSRGGHLWKPTTIVYEIIQAAERPWIIRSEQGKSELVLADVTALQVGFELSNNLEQASTISSEAPVVDGLMVRFWGSDQGVPLYDYRFRR